MYIRTRLSYASRSPHRSKLAASQFKGDEGSGFDNKREIARTVDLSVHAGDHSVFRMSKHISPVYSQDINHTIRDSFVFGYLEMNVGVAYRRHKLDFGWVNGVVGRNVNRKVKYAAYRFIKSSVGVSGDEGIILCSLPS